MTDDDHRVLASLLNRVVGAVVLSGYPCPLYDELYGTWERIEKTGPFADGARERTEVLWLRNVNLGLLF
jgi:DNA adenine methylase